MLDPRPPPTESGSVRTSKTALPLVWIVEDTRLDADLVQNALRGIAECELFKDGSEMLERIATAPALPDLLMLDWQLPEISGVDACRVIRQRHHESELPIIMLTVISSRMEMAEALEAGANDYLVKPFDSVELRARVEVALRGKRHFDRARAAELALDRERDKLLKSELKFRRLEASGIIGIIQLDLSGIVVEANDAFLEMVGRSRTDLAAGRIRMRDLTPANQIAADEAAMRELVHTGICQRYEKEIIRTDDERIIVLFGAALIERDGRRAIAYLLDVTEHRRLEADKRRLYEAEREARSAAEQASNMKDEFLATVSHELRTPLNAILGWAHIAQSKPNEDATREKALETITRNARAQAKLIEDILDISRIVSGKVRLDLVQTDLRTVTEAVVNAMLPSAETRKLSLRFTCTAPNTRVLGDADRLQQIVSNLVNNAVKFSSSGGVVDVTLEGSASSCVLLVKDRGRGIRPDFLPHVFERFRQADATPTRTHGGLGLGLAIVRNLVELHGGSVSAKSDGIGHGAEFRVELPVAAPVVAAPSKSGSAELSTAAPASSPLRGKRVLVVDDDPDGRQLLRVVLERDGAVVVAAESAEQAIEHLGRESFHAMLSDVAMPGEDGYSLVKRLRALGGEHSRIPAVALTAYARPEDSARAIAAGFDAHVSKPIDVRVVLATLARVLRPLLSQ